MSAPRLSAAAAVVIGWVGTLICAGGAAAGADAEILLNRRWAEQAFAEQSADVRPANRLVIIHEDAPGDTKLGRCAAVNAPPLQLGNKVYEHGVGVNSLSVIRVFLEKPAQRFTSVIGIDRNMDHSPASVRFHVSVDGKDVFATDVMRARAVPQAIDVPLGGATSFDLTVDVGGDDRNSDQADWADAKVILQDGSQLWLDDIGRQSTPVGGLPFSFVYGGKHSSEFLTDWNGEVKEEQLSETTLRRCVTLTDPDSGLEVQAVCTIFLDTAGADWTVYFTNKGTRDTPAIEQVRAVDATIDVGLGSNVVIRRLNGAPCLVDDWMPFDQAVSPGQQVEFSATNGRSSNVSPWFNLDYGTGGVITAIGWSGQWTASVELREGKLRTQAGMQNLHAILHPGESIRSPRIMQLYWQGGDQYRAYNLFRRTMLAHVVPRIGGRVVEPPIAHLSTAFYELNDSNEQNVLSHLDSLQGLGFEVFWLDAYWTGPNGFPHSMGNYGFPLERVEPRDRFPHGLKAIGEAVERAGLQFLMWFEPERVARGTYIAKEHPEWVIGGSGGGLLNLGMPEARMYMTDYLNAAIKQYKLTGLRIDYNIDPLGAWQAMDAKDPNRVGITEIRYIEGLYQMWDDIRRANPYLWIDDCASGGRRVDLEAVSRALVLWRSDNTCDMLDRDPKTITRAALKNQLMSAGLNRYLPFSTVGQMGATPYLFRSGFNGGIAFSEDIRGEDYPRDLLKQGIAEGKRIRRYYHGNFYPLSEATTNPRDWCVLQYHLPAAQAGMVLAFRRDQSPYGSYDCNLREIESPASYQVRVYRGYDPEPPITMEGSALSRLDLTIHEPPGSVLVEYEQVK
ncbi:MAG: NPCBM/NEW2 domain-containing protein [Pirellulaceae bacterium]|nr:NPCBM/NEW2 domain-containing protein [Pirellulaceae bacterium]